MRKWLVFTGFLLLFPWVTSLIWIHAAEAGQEYTGGEAQVQAESGLENTGTEAREGAETAVSAPIRRRILLERDGFQTYLDLEDYLPGVMVCQVDLGAQAETLKCQAVIARTYICRLMEGRSEIHEEELDLDYLGETDSGIFQSAKKREQAAALLEVCRQAAQETRGVTMQQDGRYILPLFHRMSAGRTRSGAADFPYLKAVESRWDTARTDFLTVSDWKFRDFAERINGISEGAAVTENQLENGIQVVEKDDSGYVEQMKIGARTYSGEEVQYALGLPSACYSIEVVTGGKSGEMQGETPPQAGFNLPGKRLRVLTKGSGHGYGLSQAGADAMAAEGWRCEDILQYYYQNISLISE